MSRMEMRTTSHLSHTVFAVIVAGLAAVLTWTLSNDYYLRLLFMMCMY